jgi:hypothetical protein
MRGRKSTIDSIFNNDDPGANDSQLTDLTTSGVS